MFGLFLSNWFCSSMVQIIFEHFLCIFFLLSVLFFHSFTNFLKKEESQNRIYEIFIFFQPFFPERPENGIKETVNKNFKKDFSNVLFSDCLHACLYVLLHHGGGKAAKKTKSSLLLCKERENFILFNKSFLFFYYLL